MGYIDNPDTQRANMRFIRASMRQPLLDRETELALARRWRDQADEAALHELVSAYTRLVVSMASKFRNYGLPLGDLVQEGSVGLMQAAARFEPERDIRFSTYASWWIRSAMQDYVLRNWSIVRTGTTAAQKSLFFNLRRLRARIAAASAAQMTPSQREAIARELNVNVRDVESMEGRLGGTDQSLNAPVGEESDIDWQDFLSDERAGPEEIVTGLHDTETRSRWIAEAVAQLSPREQTIIQRRRLAEEGATLEELGYELGVSKERVRQLEHRALGKLRVSLEHHFDDPRDIFAG